jgi:hypothetical protein
MSRGWNKKRCTRSDYFSALASSYYITAGRTALKRRFGSDVFDDGSKYANRFWDVIETRPYMRILQAMVRISFMNKDYNKSAWVLSVLAICLNVFLLSFFCGSEAAIEMLRLCPGDNLGQRDWLGSLLLRSGRVSDALWFVQAWMSPAADRGELIRHGGTDFGKPSSDPLISSREKTLSEFTNANLVYTAAIASFKLFGDSTASRQYLKTAANLNPIILVKILARIKPPSMIHPNKRLHQYTDLVAT